MIQQRTSLNSKNIFTEYGVLLLKGAYKAFAAAVEYKDAVSNTSNNESGTRIVELQESLRGKKQRELTISIVTTQKDKVTCMDKLDAFCVAAADGICAWSIPALGTVYNLILTKAETPEFYKNGVLSTAVLRITLIEPNPDNRSKIL
jgi:hypothetical protein